ncbi:MAG: class III signal peptide-containing protein [Candidatus Diapherotrites archaeon]
MILDKKGQGALEYLLLIGGAVLVAVIVITLLLSIADTGGTQTGLSAATSLCTQQAALANPRACGGTVLVDQITYTCGGTYPNCTATAS